MTNADVARALGETADLIELTGGNPHRARAFTRAARAIEDLDAPVAERVEAGTLTEIGGIGDAMSAHVRDLVETGSFEQHDELLSAVPPGLLNVLRVKGLGTSRVRTLWTELGVTSLEDLEQAAEDGAIETVDGFGAKTQSNILENVRRLRAYDARRRYADVVPAVDRLLKALRSHDGIQRAEATGPLRRRMETLEQADVLVAGPADAAAAVLGERLGEAPERDGDALKGDLDDGFPVVARCVDPDRFGSAWWRTTGSEAHCTAFDDAYGAPGDAAHEADVYAGAGIDFVPPELREGRGELDAAASGGLPRLLSTDDLQGVLHNHSTYSDGSASLQTMAETARSLGFSYFGICDHSQSLQVAGGLTPDEVREQQDEIETLNAAFAEDDGPSFRIFSGIESDVLSDGSLDYEDDILASFDFVVASVHSGFGMSEAAATERLVRAVENPHTRILGHPTGRLLLVREGYPVDHETVIEACAEHDVAIELNANPYRLDLDWRWVRHATESGVLVSINPDAHAADELKYVRWGVAAARKGWLTPDMCLNAKRLGDFAAWVAGDPA
jgi:DNA polymerase (family 10)